MKHTKIAMLAAAALLAAGASANEIIVTNEGGTNGQATALDLSSDGKVSAIQMRFAVPGVEKSGVNLSKCVSDLPASHAGQCNFAKNELIVMIYSDSNALLPAGVVSIGSVSFAGAKASPRLTELLAFDASASPVAVKSKGFKSAVAR